MLDCDVSADASAVGPAGATASQSATAGVTFERITTPGDHYGILSPYNVVFLEQIPPLARD